MEDVEASACATVTLSPTAQATSTNGLPATVIVALAAVSDSVLALAGAAEAELVLSNAATAIVTVSQGCDT